MFTLVLLEPCHRATNSSKNWWPFIARRRNRNRWSL